MKKQLSQHTFVAIVVAAALCSAPVVGIAGIGVHNVADVAAASAAVITAITQASDPAQACRELMAGFARGQMCRARTT